MNLNQSNALTLSLANAGLSAGTTSTYSSAATTECIINGKWGTTLAAQTNTASPTTDANTGAAFVALTDNQISVFVWGVTADGAIAVCQGSVQDTATGVTTTPGTVHTAPQFPTLPADFCPLAYTLIQTAPSAATWTFGSGEWAATGITDTWVNVAVLPDRPQIS
jgi:hypothetical protein